MSDFKHDLKSVMVYMTGVNFNQLTNEISLHLDVPSKYLTFYICTYMYLYKAVSSDLLLTCIMPDFKHDLESVMPYMNDVNFKSVYI